MTLILGVVLLVVALIIHTGAAAMWTSGRIHLRHLLDSRVPGRLALLTRLDHPAYFRLTAISGEAMVATAGALLFGAGLNIAGGVFAQIVVVLVLALVYASCAIVLATLSRERDEKVAAWTAPMLSLLIAGPHLILPPDERFSDADNNGNGGDDNRELIDEIIEEGVKEGIGDADDMKLVAGILQLRERTVAQVMVPLRDVFALPDSLSPDDIKSRIAASGYSRVPVYTDSLDHVSGLIHVLDVIDAESGELPRLRKIGRALSTERCSEVLLRMLREHRHFCMVTDADGSTRGIITLEDLLEEIVGEIRDEFDEPAADGLESGQQQGKTTVAEDR